MSDLFSFRDFAEDARQVVAVARAECVALDHFYLGVEHLFIALTKSRDGLTRKVLHHLGLSTKQTRDVVRQFVGFGSGQRHWDGIVITPRCEAIFQLARQRCKEAEAQAVGEADLLLALLDEGQSVPVRVLGLLGVARERIWHLADNWDSLVAQGEVVDKRPTPLLERFGRDLTELAGQGQLQPVIGRDDLLLQLVQALSRRNKNNPLLVGDAGVGKTAVVEGLAQLIASGETVSEIHGLRIIELTPAALVQGTPHRGEFEERVANLIGEARLRPDIVLFIDDLHTLFAPGAVAGAPEAAGFLKPLLARGEIRVIGACTFDGYRAYLEREPALARRFRPIFVDELSPAEAEAVLAARKSRYEEHHRVEIPAVALKAAVDLSHRFLRDRRLPDKALDVLDEACSRVRMSSLRPAMAPAPTAGASAPLNVTPEHVAEVIANWAQVPLTRLTTAEQNRLVRMSEVLRERIFGQDHVVEAVSRKVKLARAALADSRRPLGVFLFLGPSGVGKTALCKALAWFLFGSEDDLLRLDMSEFVEKHQVSRLIGAPPGYIGHDEPGQLTDKLRRRPFSVVLLDEIDKAHPDVFDLFLQLFDEGRLTDGKGRTVDARSALFVMTCNLGSELYYKTARVGFGGEEDETARQQVVRERVRSHFRPEFLNRIDLIEVFRPLDRSCLARIARRELQSLNERLHERQVTLTATEEALQTIAEEAARANQGGRPVWRLIERNIAEPLAELLLSNVLREGDSVRIDVRDGELVVAPVVQSDARGDASERQEARP